MKKALLLLLAISLALVARSDLPVHCGKSLAAGKWTLKLHQESFVPNLLDSQTTCGHFQPNQPELRESFAENDIQYQDDVIITLENPNIATSSSGSKGTWTNIYDEGLFIDIDDQVFFSHYRYVRKGFEFESQCNFTLNGWTYSKDKQDSEWRCFFMSRDEDSDVASEIAEKFSQISDSKPLQKINTRRQAFLAADPINMEHVMAKNYEDNHEYVKHLNAENSTWKAGFSPVFYGAKTEDIHKALNDRRYMTENPVFNHKKAAQMSMLQDDAALTNEELEITNTEVPEKDILKYLQTDLDDIPDDLPKNWDWRSINGKNFVTSTKSQRCGSCYTVAFMSAMESRLNIKYNKQDHYRLSVDFSLQCNFYTECCDGGYPFLVAKFGQEFGIMPDKCTTDESECATVCDQSLVDETYSVDSYGYLGGYYGGNTELAMMKEIRARGPILVAIQVPSSFSYYKSGVFIDTNASCENMTPTKKYEEFGSFGSVGHSVNAVGYGEEDDGTKFWVVQNSWGKSWGNNGFIKIRRGCNDIEIESLVLTADISAQKK
eukprot:CAMPEP_0115038942 /NCGR_PEP_ID=MMETSP0216-20121206/43711_1 /TAXON_ID=223996 /ORGANISM="Protocruzia adherens, Strain Boccale" /LENGTH=546 /DNA_ID=CAMNT_0002419443 /DNA_START=53 /DNA_END=1693 /DNA_ORIENTATION=-